jgi:hypothetical protein
MTARVAMRMPLLDVAFQLMDSARSPQDFSLILHFRDAPNLEGLYAGARSAMNRFPVSASCIDGRRWVWRENKCFILETVATKSDCETRSAIERFVDEPFDLHHQPPVKQALALHGPNGATLVTRFHHSAADGLSAALWLGHQLNVAYGIEAVETERAPFVDLALRHLPTSVRRSDFAFDGASDRLWTSNSSEHSGARRWATIDFPASELQRACRRVGGFTYNDLLATCTLEVLCQWNTSHCGNNCRGGTPWPPVPSNHSHKPRIGLWMPMNIRREANAGFGNGTSRIRLYARYKADASLVEKCREVRRQVSWTTGHGEWVVPEMPWFTRVPRALTRPLLRVYLNLSSVDMCTGVFSHAGSSIANAGEAFKHVDRIECVGLLHARQSVAINAATHHGQTWLTFTFDPRLLSAEEVQQLGQMYGQQMAVARDELL